MRFDGCACSGKTLMRLLRPAVLRVLADGPLHGYVISQRLGELAMFRDSPADATGLYRTLKTMEKEGLLTSEWDTGKSGPARRRYRITAMGRKCLEQWKKTLSDYGSALADMLAWLGKRRDRGGGDDSPVNVRTTCRCRRAPEARDGSDRSGCDSSFRNRRGRLIPPR